MFQADYQYTPLKEYAAMRNSETNINGYQSKGKGFFCLRKPQIRNESQFFIEILQSIRRFLQAFVLEMLSKDEIHLKSIKIYQSDISFFLLLLLLREKKRLKFNSFLLIFSPKLCITFVSLIQLHH